MATAGSGTGGDNTVLTREVMESLRGFGLEKRYSEGDVVVERGQEGDAFYIVLEGRLNILLNQGGRRLCLATIGAGASFGEMSLLSGEPISANVEAVSETSLLVISAEEFHRALGTSEALRDHVLVRLSSNLRRTSSEAWDLYQRTEALASLMSGRNDNEPIVAKSGAMRRIVDRIEEQAAGSSPLMIVGEPGTGKSFLAHKIYAACAEEKSLVELDCGRQQEGQAQRVLFGTDDEPDFVRAKNQAGKGQLKLQGALHVADGGTMILRHVDRLDRNAQGVLARYLDILCAGEEVFPRVRIIATSSEDIEWLAKGDEFDEGLANRLSANMIEMPTLRKRRRDIVELARLFARVPRERFSTAAENALVSREYRYRNAAELREAVELAVNVADGATIEAEHIFTGPKSQRGGAEVDVTGSGLVQFLTKRWCLRFLQACCLAFFAGIILLCFTAGDTLIGRIANTLVWALWWPGLLILFLFIGRLWCTICPISAVGRTVRLLGSLGWSPPAWMKDHAGWTMAVLFLVIVWVEHVFHMTHQPFATAILLVGLMSMPVVFCTLFQREVWCRFLCPLGSLAASYSICSTVQVHANPDVCTSRCSTHECFKGSDVEVGCPVFHHPLYVRDAHFCKLCFTCLRSCPHKSARLYIHAPLQNLWRLGEIGTTLAPFALIVFFESLVLLASHKIAALAGAWGFTLATFGAVGAGSLLYFFLMRVFSGDFDSAMVSRVALALLVLGWGPFMAFHLGNVPELNSVLIRAEEGSTLSSFLNSGRVSLLLVLQFAGVLLSAALAAICLWRIGSRRRRKGTRIGLIPLETVGGLCVVYVVTSVLLILM